MDIDWKSIQKKWHNLMSTYKRNKNKPREEVVWEYFDVSTAHFPLAGQLGCDVMVWEYCTLTWVVSTAQFPLGLQLGCDVMAWEYCTLTWVVSTAQFPLGR